MAREHDITTLQADSAAPEGSEGQSTSERAATDEDASPSSGLFHRSRLVGSSLGHFALPSALIYLARCRREQGRIDEAIVHAKEAVRIAAANSRVGPELKASARHVLGAEYAKLERFDEAQVELIAALRRRLKQKKPAEDRLRLLTRNIERLLIHRAKGREALKDLDAAGESDPEAMFARARAHAEAWNILAELSIEQEIKAWLQERIRGSAMKDLEISLKAWLDPKRVEASSVLKALKSEK